MKKGLFKAHKYAGKYILQKLFPKNFFSQILKKKN